MEENKLKLSTILTAIALLSPLVGWGVLVEVRLSKQDTLSSLGSRVTNLEEILTPLIIDYKVKEILEERGSPVSIGFDDSLPKEIEEVVEQTRQEAEEWTNQKFQMAR